MLILFIVYYHNTFQQTGSLGFDLICHGVLVFYRNLAQFNSVMSSNNLVKFICTSKLLYSLHSRKLKKIQEIMSIYISGLDGHIDINDLLFFFLGT